MSFEVSSGAFKMPLLSHQTLWISPCPPLELSGSGFVMPRLTQGHHWLGKLFAELINHKGVAPSRGIYIGVLRGPGAYHCESSKWQKTTPSGARANVFSAFSQPEDRGFRLETTKLRWAKWTLRKWGRMEVFWYVPQDWMVFKEL